MFHDTIFIKQCCTTAIVKSETSKKYIFSNAIYIKKTKFYLFLKYIIYFTMPYFYVNKQGTIGNNWRIKYLPSMKKLIYRTDDRMVGIEKVKAKKSISS